MYCAYKLGIEQTETARMSHRSSLVKFIQDLSRKEALQQPSAADWLRGQDDKARLRRERDQGLRPAHDYQDDDGGEADLGGAAPLAGVEDAGTGALIA